MTRDDATPLRKYSPRKIETAREKTREIKRARKDVMSVPTRKGREPNRSATGSQTVPVMKAKPFRAMAGIDATNNDARIAASRRMTPTPVRRSSRLKAVSDMRAREPRTAPEYTLAASRERSFP